MKYRSSTCVEQYLPFLQFYVFWLYACGNNVYRYPSWSLPSDNLGSLVIQIVPMRKSLVTALLWAALSSSTLAQDAVPEAGVAISETAPDTIIITGQRPGPGLWKVSKGDNVLWLFGTYGPLPKDLAWRSQQVETILAGSQEILHAPDAIYNPGFFRGLTLLPFAIGFKNNPDGATLRDRLAPEVYERWLVLKKKYIGDDDSVERYRPFFAADLLYKKGLERAGLTGGKQVNQAIDALARKHKLTTTRPHLALQVDNPRALLKEYKKTPMDDAACFEATISRLETDIATLRARADAWAKGDIATIRAVGFDDRDAACSKAFMGVSAFREVIETQANEARMRDAWLAAARKALDTNKSTFAVLPIKTLLGAGDAMAKLREQGYTIESPE